MLKICKLQNGTTVLLNHSPNSRSISCYGYFPYGVATEPLKQLGITHLIEHLIFCSIEGYPKPLDVATAFEEIGVVTDAVTARDMMFCGIQAPIDSFENGFFLLTEVLLNSKFTPENVINEKKVIQEELEYYTSDPEYYVWNAISETLWGVDHPCGRRVEGRINTLNSLTYEEIKNYYTSYYIPQQLVLVIDGAFDPQKMDYILNKYVNLYPQREMVETMFEELEVNYSSCAYYNSDGDITWGGIGFTLPEGPIDRVKLYLLETLLTEGNSSLLQQHLREEKGLLYQLISSSGTSRLSGEYALSFYTSQENWDQTLEILQEELKAAINFSDKAFEVAKARAIANISFVSERTNNHVRFIGRNYLVHGQLMNADDTCVAISKVTAEELREYMHQIFNLGRTAIVRIGK